MSRKKPGPWKSVNREEMIGLGEANPYVERCVVFFNEITCTSAIWHHFFRLTIRQVFAIRIGRDI